MNMDGQMQLFWILLISGAVLTGAEIFVPGGIVGSLGVFALAGAIAMGFKVYGPTYGWLIATGIVLLGAVAVGLWIKFFPRSAIGRKMTIGNDLASAKASDPSLKALAGKRGIATSDLRPSGYATVENRRVDVVTEGGMIDKGMAVEVVRVEGSRVVVKALPAQ
jgi:membrane-bound serine protease (ClpP class)